jgi:hypothetical protein
MELIISDDVNLEHDVYYGSIKIDTQFFKNIEYSVKNVFWQEYVLKVKKLVQLFLLEII